MENKQSAVEWLYETLWKQTNFSLPNNILEQAKQMHKEEVIQAWKKGDGQFDDVAEKTSLEYYNETYGKAN